MRRQDYFRRGSHAWLRLHEKAGKRHDIPAHHRAAETLDDYLEAAELDEAKAPLFQSVDPAGCRLTGRALSRCLVLAMVKRRPAAAGLPPSTCCHTFRATGITAYLSNGGTLKHAQQIAGHASPKTTKLYDRTAETITVDEIERIVICGRRPRRTTATLVGSHRDREVVRWIGKQSRGIQFNPSANCMKLCTAMPSGVQSIKSDGPAIVGPGASPDAVERAGGRQACRIPSRG